jgi:hypothetical protein
VGDFDLVPARAVSISPETNPGPDAPPLLVQCLRSLVGGIGFEEIVILLVRIRPSSPPELRRHSFERLIAELGSAAVHLMLPPNDAMRSPCRRQPVRPGRWLLRAKLKGVAGNGLDIERMVAGLREEVCNAAFDAARSPAH